MRANARVARTAGLACALAVAACHQVLGPSKPDTNWHVLDTVHFSLHTRPGTFAEQSAPTLGQVLDDQYEVTQRIMQTAYDERVSGFLYNNAADAGFETEHTGTAYADTAAFRATATPPLDANLFALVSHEANHVVLIGSLGRAGTYMMNEGLASSVISERFHKNGKTSYYSWTKSHRAQIPSIERLSDDEEWTKVPSNIAYSASASFLAYLVDTYGAVKLRQLYYARSGEFVRRFGEIYGRPLADVEQSWLAFCDAV